jgi:hypothetical protein
MGEKSNAQIKNALPPERERVIFYHYVRNQCNKMLPGYG